MDFGLGFRRRGVAAHGAHAARDVGDRAERDGHAVAAIVPMTDLDRIDPPDPAAGGSDPLLALAGTCKHDDFVDSLSDDLGKTSLWHRTRPGRM